MQTIAIPFGIKITKKTIFCHIQVKRIKEMISKDKMKGLVEKGRK